LRIGGGLVEQLGEVKRLQACELSVFSPYVGMNGGVKVVAIYAQALQQRGRDVLVNALPPPPKGLKSRLRDWIARRAAPCPCSVSHLDRKDFNHRVLDKHWPIQDADFPDAYVVVATWWKPADWLNAMSARKGQKYYLVWGREDWPSLPLDRVRATYRAPLKKVVASPWLQSIMANEYDQHDVSLVNNSEELAQFFAPPRAMQARPAIGFLFSHVGPTLKGGDVALCVD
jgi:hypothetical protein